MKKFIPVGNQYQIVRASFMAPATVTGVITSNKRYDIIDPIQSVSPCLGGSVIGYFESDEGYQRAFLGSLAGEVVPVRIEDQIDLHAIQKRRLRYRYMMVKAFKRAFRNYGWDDSKKNAFGFSNRRNPRFKDNQYQIHSLAEYARMNADHYFDNNGNLFEDYHYVPEHEITQAHFDEMALEDISNW